MKKSPVINLVFLGILFIAILVGCGKKADSYRVIKVDNIDGTVSVERTSSKDVLSAFDGMQLVSEDVVSVDLASELLLLMDSDKHMLASENTKFEIEATGSSSKGSIKINLLEGNGLFTIDQKLNSDSSFEVTTPNATLSVRGTTFSVGYDSSSKTSTIEVIEGVVAVSNSDGSDEAEVTAGEIKTIQGDSESGFSDGSNESDDTGSSISGFSSSFVPKYTIDSPGGIQSMYREVCENMTDYISGIDALSEDYVSYDYMYFDYDQDGEGDVILYLRYFVDKKMMIDLAFLYYNPSTDRIEVRAINKADDDDSCFYGSYNNMLVRYSWITGTYESYLYSVQFVNGNLTYVLEAAYDEILLDYESKGIVALPLYLHAGQYTDISPFLN